MELDIKRLTEIDERIQEIAREFGLDFFPQEFDIIPAQKMLEILAYHFPVNFSHWSFGRDYERERTQYEYGMGIPYEIVLNSDPSRAFLMNTNPFPVQVMVMAHVYAHNDFMKRNKHFGPTRRDILPSASETALRLQSYEKRHGIEEVESLIDAGMSIELNTDPHFFIAEESEEEQRERLAKPPALPEMRGAFEDLLGRKTQERPTELQLLQKTPLEPERDVIGYIMTHSPKPLREWEKDILSVVRDQSRYFMPQRRTKIMNEGWATFWHMKIMERLFQEGALNADEHGYYNLYNARVLALNPRTINPYLVGLKILVDIEDRWNKGRFGREWEEANSAQRRDWDLKLGFGRGQIFAVRSSYTDRFFIEHFLTKELVEDLKLYLYERQQDSTEIRYIITEKDFERIKRLLVSHHSSFGVPLIMVDDGDYKGKRELYLKHAFEGVELDTEYRQKTLEYIFYLWGRPVHVETVVKEKKFLHSYDGQKHS